MARRVSDNTVVVIGLGRFGSELAKTLMTLGREVLAVERDPYLVQQMAPLLTLAVEGDGTSADTLRSLGVEEVGTAVVAIGTSLEASLLATSALAEVGVNNIWAKAVTERHKEILIKVGAKHVIFPELDMGNRVAHQLVRGDVSEYIEFSNGYALAMIKAPKSLVGQTPGEAQLLTRRRVTCVGIQRAGTQDFEAVSGSTRIERDDLLVVAGRKRFVELFTMED